MMEKTLLWLGKTPSPKQCLNDYATMAKSTVVPFELPSEFSPDPLTKVIQNGAKALLRTAIQAEVSSFIAEHAHLLDEEGRQRLVRHGFLPEREVMTGIGTVS
jgi:putative transposase